ncbi:Phosphotyrosyl phosphatase activator, partial [Fistulina hepatica ATCC 64428]
LRQITYDHILKMRELPTNKITTDDDVSAWTTTTSYADYAIFLNGLCAAIVGCSLPWPDEGASPAIKRTLDLLDTLDTWIDEIPPQETPQRFGNLSFRTWGKRLDERADELLRTLLGDANASHGSMPSRVVNKLLPLIRPYFTSAFGSFTRMDYGTGHETSFMLFLLCLALVRFFDPTDEAEQRNLALLVFCRYLRLCWHLQDVYRLEPAGSHGVWGLDDSCFIPYILGSAQLLEQSAIPVSAVLKPPLPPTNLYFMAIMRINQVKTGPFYEHSSQLHAIASSVPYWPKVHHGMCKMYKAEVLGKRVVVQHIPLGGLLTWDP